VEEALVSGRRVALGLKGGKEIGSTCATIFSLLDGLSDEETDVREEVGRVVAKGEDEWRYDAEAMKLNQRVTGRGRDLDATCWRIVAAMQHVVDVRNLGSLKQCAPSGDDKKTDNREVIAHISSVDPGSVPPRLLTSPLRGTGTDVSKFRKQSHGRNVFLSGLDDSSDEDGGETEIGGGAQNAEGADRGSVGRGGAAQGQTRKQRIAALRVDGVWRKRSGQGRHAELHVEEARHDSVVSQQRLMVSAVAEREGLHVSMGLRLLLLRHLADVRCDIRGLSAM
jgi:hypothetical protein